MNVVIIDYKAGNTRSVQFALARLGVAAQLRQEAAIIQAADRVIFPGVGAAGWAMEQLAARGLTAVIPALQQPVLGICLGMQLLCAHSEEGAVPGLGVFPTTVRALQPTPLYNVPHVGWNTLAGRQDSPLLKDIPNGSSFYFVHSYAVPTTDYTSAEAVHGSTFSAMLERDNFYATQFHPEKSGALGAKILENFMQLKD